MRRYYSSAVTYQVDHDTDLSQAPSKGRTHVPELWLESTMMGFPLTARMDSKNARVNLAYDRNGADGLRFS